MMRDVKRTKTFMRIIAAAMIFATACFAFTPARAEGPAKGVVELFTSQGCAYCPPADAALGEVITHGGFVALAWHVDYWDQGGWKDTFSSHAATERQQRYASRVGGGIYTPEFVMNGGSGSAGASAASSILPVSVSVSDGKAKIGAGDGDADVFLVSFFAPTKVAIARGENAGHEITYRHAVSGMRKLGTWNGEAMTLPAGGGNCAVILQRPDQGEIIGAALC